jgi:hypothetical protein
LILHIKERTQAEVFENVLLRRICGPKREEVTGENSIIRSFIICTPHHSYDAQIK